MSSLIVSLGGHLNTNTFYSVAAGDDIKGKKQACIPIHLICFLLCVPGLAAAGVSADSAVS